MTLKLAQTFLWKIHAEVMHRKLVQYPFLILVNKAKQALHAIILF